MIRPILSGILVLMVSLAIGQVQTQVIGDSVRVRSNTGTAELILENSTKNVNGFLYNKGNGRTEFRKALDYTVQSLHDSTIILWNVATGINASVTLGGTGRTLSITNPEAGHTYTIKVAQDTSGNRTIGTWPANTQWPGGTPPSLTASAGKYDIVNFYYDGTNYYGTYHQNFLTTPTVSIYSSDTKSGTGSTVHALTGVPAGALLVLTTAFDGSQTNCTVTSSPSLTWTKRADASAPNSGDAEIWTAVYTAGGSISVTSNWPNVNTEYQASVCYVVINQETSLTVGSNTATAQTQPSVSLTTTRANSIVFCVTADYDALDGSGTRAYRDGSSTEALYSRSASASTFYHYYRLAPTITSYTEGLTAPSPQKGGTAVIEIRGN